MSDSDWYVHPGDTHKDWRSIVFRFGDKAWVTLIPLEGKKLDIVLGEGVTLTEGAERFLATVRALLDGEPVGG